MAKRLTAKTVASPFAGEGPGMGVVHYQHD